MPKFLTDYDFDLLNEYLYYDESSPTFLRWKKDIFSGSDYRIKNHTENDPAGCIRKDGYATVRIKRKEYKIHRVVLTLAGIEIEEMFVDHVDGNRSNNNIKNLRLVSSCENMRNQKKFSTNKTGVTGVALQTDSLGYPSYVAHVIDNLNKRIRRCFSISKYGELEAFRLACEWREKKIQELNEQGAGYTDRHGK